MLLDDYQTWAGLRLLQLGPARSYFTDIPPDKFFADVAAYEAGRPIFLSRSGNFCRTFRAASKIEIAFLKFLTRSDV